VARDSRSNCLRADIVSLREEQFLEIVRRNVKSSARRAVTLDARLRDDLSLDSLGVITIMMAIEQETRLPVFEIDPMVGEINTLRDLMRLITRGGPAPA
jgi:acyl carrier protein